jgi:5-methylcytosine-specific restriction endonuclease McrA
VKTYSLVHLSNATLVREFLVVIRRERGITAEVLAYLAEFDERKLYLPAGYPSMYAYCVGELHFSEDEACRRIRAARAARQFPVLFEALAEGRLHLTALVMLAPYFSRENVEELSAAATHQSKAGIEQLIADRFPRSELLTLVQPLPPAQASAPARIEPGAEPSALARMENSARTPAKAAPLAPERYALQVTIGRKAHEALQYAQTLLGHKVPSGDLAAVLERLIQLGVRQLERKKFGATSRPRRSRPHASANPRHIPAEVKRAVWERDGGQCTYVATNSHRCPPRTRLEFDHIEEVARGGQATVENVRLRCRAHNQFSAERAFGSDFMRRKREEARVAAKEHARTEAERAPKGTRPEPDPERDVVPCLRRLGYGADQAKWAAELCDKREDLRDASIEDRIKYALYCLAPSCVRRKAAV